jgi:hypothetical protein
MVLAFVMGLVPSYDADSTRAASSTDGRVDMVDLLDMILGSKQAGAITLQSGIEGVIVKTPVDNFQTPEIPVPLQAFFNPAAPAGTDVTFVANPVDDPTAFPQANRWVGDAFTSVPVDFPFVSALDVGPLLTGQVNLTGRAVAIYALTNAAQLAKAATFSYEDASDPADALNVFLIETPAGNEVDTLDADPRNGLPDDLFNQIAPGEIWVTNVIVNGVLRTVMVANLNNSSGGKQALGDVFVSPTGNITVQTPNLQAFIDAGIIEDSQAGFVVVEVVDDLAGLLDQVDGSSLPGDIAAWVQTANDMAPGVRTAGSQFVEISLLYSLSSGGFAEADNLYTTDLDVRLTMTGLDTGGNDGQVQLWSYPTSVTGPTADVLANDPNAPEEWSLMEGASVAGGVLDIALDRFSVFAPFNSGLSLLTASPTVIPQGFAADVTLTGIVPTMTALSVAQAAAAYSITVDGQAASFRLGPAKQADAAITAYDGTNPNTLYITVPALTTLGDVDVTITDLDTPANTFTAVGLLTVSEVFSVTVTNEGTTSAVTLDPVNSDGLPAGSYLAGANVQASVTFNAAVETFTGWSINGVPFSTATIINFSVDQDITLLASFEPVVITGYTLTVTSTAGGSVTAVPDPDLPGGQYTPGSVVSLTATPLAGFVFTGWTGPSAGDLVNGPAAAVNGIQMNANKVLQANFTGITFLLTVAVNPAGAGSVAQNPAPGVDGRYAVNQVVGLTATAAAGFEFVNWTGGVLNPTLATTTVLMNSDKTVTANFAPITSGTGWTPQPGDTGGRANVWVFGGVVRTLLGTGLTDATPLAVVAPGQAPVAVQGFRAAANGTSVDLVVPPLPGYSAATTPAMVEADLVVGVAPNQTVLPILRYRRYVSEGGINTTSFITNTAAVSNVDVNLSGAGADLGELELPVLEAVGRPLFGIVRTAKLTDVAKANTSVLAGQLGTGNITTAESGNLIPNAFDFAFYLYAPEAAKNTPPAGSAAFGSALTADGSPLFDVPGPAVDANGNVGVRAAGALITLPVGGAFTYAEADDGLAMWGQASEYDYATNELLNLPLPVEVAYQSQLLKNELDPDMVLDANGNATNVGAPVNIDKARLYSLNGFSLRKGSLLPSEVADLIRVATASGVAKGDVAGGTTVKISSPLGGLAYVDRVVLKSAAKAINLTAKPSSLLGVTETAMEFKTPKASEPGIVDLVIYLKSAPNTPAVTLERVFEYTRASQPLDALALILIGLLIALIGLAAGGESGGGGGGPCFIATAAYGTPLAAEIDTLRAVRDGYMLDSAIGTAVVDLYYQVSPPIADVVARSPMLAALVRVLLVPVIFLGKVALVMPTLTAFVGLSLGAAYMLRRRARGRA